MTDKQTHGAPAHRKGTARAQIRMADGSPAPPGTKVTIKQTDSAVKFGCAGFETVRTANNMLSGEDKANAEIRVEKMLGLFNFITLPFYWGRYEPVRGKPMTEPTLRAAEWLRDRGVMVKGHPLCWHTVCADWLLEYSDAEILRLQLERIERDVTAFKGVIDTWDVINEVVIMPVFDRYDNAVTRICKREGQVGLVKKVFDQARRANKDATLLINDFDMSSDYSDLIARLLDNGVCIDAIGLQSHMHQGCWAKDKTEEILDRFSKFGLPLHFTEINMVSGRIMPAHIVDLNDFVPDEWPSTEEGEERQARELTEFYEILFNHPQVEAITYWSFSDGGWLNAPAGLVTKDGRIKPSYTALYDLIHRKWRTPGRTAETGSDGCIEISGFKGTYEAQFNGGNMKFDIK